MNDQIKSLLRKKSSYEINKRNLNEDHLKEGIGSYIYTKPARKINPSRFVNKSKFTKIQYESTSYFITQRVIYPDKDIIKSRPISKKILSTEKNSKNYKLGIFKSFIDKTPNLCPAKFMRNKNRSYDNLKRGHDIFLRNNKTVCKTESIFGVERKRRNKIHNYESDAPKFKFYRKFFFEKAKNVNNIFL